MGFDDVSQLSLINISNDKVQLTSDIMREIILQRNHNNNRHNPLENTQKIFVLGNIEIACMLHTKPIIINNRFVAAKTPAAITPVDSSSPPSSLFK